jgi:hypothetical protein
VRLGLEEEEENHRDFLVFSGLDEFWSPRWNQVVFVFRKKAQFLAVSGPASVSNFCRRHSVRAQAISVAIVNLISTS